MNKKSYAPSLLGALFFLGMGQLHAADAKIQLDQKSLGTFDVRGDLLYWVPQASGLSVNFGSGSVLETTIGSVNHIVAKESDVDPSFDWSLGYRVGAGYQFNQSPWEVDALWTHFYGSGRSDKNHGKWSVQLNQIDLDTMCNAVVTPSLTLSPLVGLRGTQIHQRLWSTIVTEITVFPTGSGTDTRTFHDHQHYNAMGPLFGLNTDYKLGKGFSIYGGGSAAVLYGSYWQRFQDAETVTVASQPESITSHITKRMQSFNYSVDLALGLQWKAVIYRSLQVMTKLGLENHQYFSQSRLGSSWGDLSFSGAIFSAEFLF